MLEGLGMSTASSWMCFQQSQGHMQPGRLRFVRAIVLETTGGQAKGHTPETSGFLPRLLMYGIQELVHRVKSSLPASERQGDLSKGQNNSHLELQNANE